MLKATLIKKLGLNKFKVKFSDTGDKTYEVTLKDNQFYLIDRMCDKDQEALFRMLKSDIINFKGDL